MAERQVVYDKGGVNSTIDGILKDDYVLNQIIDTVNKSTVFLSRLKSNAPTHGRKFIFPIQTGVSQGVGARGENKQLPDAGFGEYDQASGNVKYLYSTIYITGPAIESTKGSKAAFADALKTALKDARDGLTLDMQRQVWGDGTGLIAKVNGAVTSSTTVPVDSPYGLTYDAADALTNDEKVRLFKRNMSLFIDSTTDVTARVTAVNNDGSITVASAISADAAAPIYRGDATDATRTSKDSEILGITGAVKNSGTYFGVDRTGVPEWQSSVIDLSGPITEDAMRQALDKALINGTAQPDLILTDFKTRRRYEGLLQAQKRFANPMKLEGGHTALEFDGMPLVADKDAPPQNMWFLRSSDWSWYSMKDIGWIERDGAVLHRVDDYDAFKAVMCTYRELVCKRPNNQVRLHDITG